MTDLDLMNREVAQALGIEWHELSVDDGQWVCSCEKNYYWEDSEDAHKHLSLNPDFSDDAGAVQLLRLMKESKYWPEFYGHIQTYRLPFRDKRKWEKMWETLSSAGACSMDADLITTRGKMLTVVHEWFKKGVIKE